jgi:hypothetical protein
MQLEAQLADARLAKAKMEMAAEKEVLLQEKQRLLMVIIQQYIYLGHCYIREFCLNSIHMD